MSLKRDEHVRAIRHHIIALANMTLSKPDQIICDGDGYFLLQNIVVYQEYLECLYKVRFPLGRPEFPIGVHNGSTNSV